MATFKSILDQPVKTGWKPASTGDGKGTQRTSPSGKLSAGQQRIAKQRVKREDPYAAVKQQVSERQKTKLGTRTPKEAKDADHKFIDGAKERFNTAAEAEAEVRKLSLDDLKFLAGEQWPEDIRASRTMDGRPCLTINRMPQFVRQVTNEQRQNRPSIQVNPVDDEADTETAEVIQGIVRHIEYDSGADTAYDTAFFGAASCGFGYWRITTEYSGPFTFEQDIKIKRVRNPFTVYLDPNAIEPDFSDANWGFVVSTMSKDEFKAAYPKAELSKMDDWESVGDTAWLDKDSCRVVEYYWREKTTETIAQLEDGSVILKDLLPEGVRAANERETEITSVKWAKLNAVEILEETEWARRWIPIIKVVGDEFDIDGKLVLKGIVRDAKEPQQQYNYMKSASTEAIALAPKAPYVIAEGQLEGYEDVWQTANTKNHAFLPYKPQALGGAMVSPPQRNVTEPAIQAITMAMGGAADDLKSVTGIYDAALGAQGNETSGKAILARQQQTQGGNFHYIDNLTRAIRHCGRVILDLIPKIYDTPRVIRIIGPEGDQKTVQVNAQQQDAALQQEAANIQPIYDLSVGKYDVTISTGPSYQSKRQEAVASMLDLVKADPQVLQVAGDLLVKNMDWPGAKEIAERLHKMLPPQLQDEEQTNQAIPPQAQQAISQMTQQIQELTQALQKAEADVQQHISVKQLETNSREKIAASDARLKELELRLEALKIQATVVIAQQKLNVQIGEGEAQRLWDQLSQITGEHHQAAMAQMEHEHSIDQQQHAFDNAPAPTDGEESGQSIGDTNA